VVLLEAATLVLVGVFGLVVGSFLNVAIYRLPRECLSVWRQTRSRCPRCGVQLTWYDNIPVLSYLVLRGRCRRCQGRIAWRYPLVELACGVAFVLLARHDLGEAGLVWPGDHQGAWLLFAGHAAIVAVLLVLSVVDLDFRILPDALTLPGIVLGPFLVLVVPELMPEPRIAFGDLGVRATVFMNALVGAIGGGGLLYGIGWAGSKAFRKPAMGLGDVKLFAAMGAVLGPWVPLALVVACFAGALIGIVVMLVARHRYVPFGPFLGLGMVATMLYGPEILAAVWPC